MGVEAEAMTATPESVRPGGARLEARRLRMARRAGAVLMGLILGLGLLPAILELLAVSGDVMPFKYQNF